MQKYHIYTHLHKERALDAFFLLVALYISINIYRWVGSTIGKVL